MAVVSCSALGERKTRDRSARAPCYLLGLLALETLFALRTPSLRLSVVRFVVFASSPGIRPAALSSKRNAPSHNPMPTQDELKKQVGFKAVDDYVQSGMVIGLGTGR